MTIASRFATGKRRAREKKCASPAGNNTWADKHFSRCFRIRPQDFFRRPHDIHELPQSFYMRTCLKYVANPYLNVEGGNFLEWRIRYLSERGDVAHIMEGLIPGQHAGSVLTAMFSSSGLHYPDTRTPRLLNLLNVACAFSTTRASMKMRHDCSVQRSPLLDMPSLPAI